LLILDLSYNHFENLSTAALTSGKWKFLKSNEQLLGM
jgi:hypothetical protein